MMHYRKGENIEKEITKEDLPFDDCLPKGQENFLWMHVKGGTKVSNVVSHVKNAFDKEEYRTVVWSGSGGGVVKTISCAEILKRSFPLYQVTRMCYTSIEEHWKPQMEGLEEIIANRQIPCIHILMSLEAIDDSIDGLQKPNTTTDFWVNSDNNATPSQARPPPHRNGKQRPQHRSGNAQKPHRQPQKDQPQRPRNKPRQQEQLPPEH